MVGSPLARWTFGLSVCVVCALSIYSCDDDTTCPTDGSPPEPAGWYAQESPTTNTLFGVFARDKNTVVAVGEGGVIARTTNGGDTWTLVASGTTESLLAVSFAGNLGWAAGVLGVIIHTADGGVTWAPQASGTTNSFRNLAFADANTGWAVATGGTILKTVTAGEPR
jgi:photosystem II stability/assembly factor-like uncharacterized protein